MLPTACRWIEAETGFYLMFNYRNVAVLRKRDGYYELELKWGEREHHDRVRSAEKGKQWIERWIANAKGPPGAPRRRR